MLAFKTTALIFATGAAIQVQENGDEEKFSGKSLRSQKTVVTEVQNNLDRPTMMQRVNTVFSGKTSIFSSNTKQKNQKAEECKTFLASLNYMDLNMYPYMERFCAELSESDEKALVSEMLQAFTKEQRELDLQRLEGIVGGGYDFFKSNKNRVKLHTFEDSTTPSTETAVESSGTPSTKPFSRSRRTKFFGKSWLPFVN